MNAPAALDSVLGWVLLRRACSESWMTSLALGKLCRALEGSGALDLR